MRGTRNTSLALALSISTLGISIVITYVITQEVMDSQTRFLLTVLILYVSMLALTVLSSLILGALVSGSSKHYRQLGWMFMHSFAGVLLICITGLVMLYSSVQLIAVLAVAAGVELAYANKLQAE